MKHYMVSLVMASMALSSCAAVRGVEYFGIDPEKPYLDKIETYTTTTKLDLMSRTADGALRPSFTSSIADDSGYSDQELANIRQQEFLLESAKQQLDAAQKGGIAATLKTAIANYETELNNLTALRIHEPAKANSAVYAYCEQLEEDLLGKQAIYSGVGTGFTVAAGIISASGLAFAVSRVLNPEDVSTKTTVAPDKTTTETTKTVNTPLITAVGAIATVGVAITGLFAATYFSSAGQAYEAYGDLKVGIADAQRRHPSTSEKAHYIELLAACRATEGRWYKSREGILDTVMAKQLK